MPHHSTEKAELEINGPISHLLIAEYTVTSSCTNLLASKFRKSGNNMDVA